MLAVSCVTQKEMTYLRDADSAKADSINAHFTPQSEMIIRNGDMLTVFVSALDKEWNMFDFGADHSDVAVLHGR